MLNASLATRRDVGDELCLIRVRPDTGVPPFQAGQFVRLGLYELGRGTDSARLIKRAYSIASSPDDKDGLEFFLVKVRGGQLTPEVWELEAGDRLWVDARIQGEFTLRDIDTDSDLLMLATGTGISPYVSMLRTYAGTQRWRRLTIVHGARRSVELGYREELEAAAARHPDVRYVPVVSREPDAHWTGLRGRVLQVLEPATYERITGGRLDSSRTHVFLCGNPDMVQAARTELEPRGFVMSQRRRPGNLHTERYW